MNYHIRQSGDGGGRTDTGTPGDLTVVVFSCKGVQKCTNSCTLLRVASPLRRPSIRLRHRQVIMNQPSHVCSVTQTVTENRPNTERVPIHFSFTMAWALWTRKSTMRYSASEPKTANLKRDFDGRIKRTERELVRPYKTGAIALHCVFLLCPYLLRSLTREDTHL